ncbi:MAG: hypothetical protein HZB33_00260 [Nitrospirae bacterium]|nr:hypothetical protein [Nitrospirota bacterium]
MAEGTLERRTCGRFVIPGTAAFCGIEGIISSGPYIRDAFSVADISRGELSRGDKHVIS